MINTETFEANPPNSQTNVLGVLDAKFNFENSEVPECVMALVKLLGVEKEESGGVAAMSVCVNEFLGWRKGFPDLNRDPTLKEFADYLFSPKFNYANVFQVLDLASTSQVGILGAPGQIPAVTVQKTLKVKVYNGTGWETDFPKLDGGKAPDLFVKLSILGLPIDEGTVKKTEVKKNCWEPGWGEEFVFLLHSPEDASLLVEVYDRDRFSRDDFAGKISLPVSELRMGIRAVPLFDEKGIQCSAARLLMRFMLV